MSILNDIKACLGIDESETVFDTELLILINSVLSNLNQLNIGPEDGYVITGDTEEWSELETRIDITSLRTYVYLKVRMLFDPPATSFLIDAIQRQISELEWRLNIQVDIPIIEEEVVEDDI